MTGARLLDLETLLTATEAATSNVTFAPNLHDYDVVLLNSSGGKDSAAMKAHVVELAARQGFDRDRMLVVHADLGRVEWPGTHDLVQQQCQALNLRMTTVARDEDLLDQVVTRHTRLRAKGDTTTPAWPSSSARYCTSDQKTSQVTKLMTELAAAHRHAGKPGRIRILNCLGIRAEESHARAKKIPFGPDPATWTVAPRAGSADTTTRPAREARPGVRHGRRHVDRWLPIFNWSTKQVWATIHCHGLPYHPAYDLGMPRLSCIFCVLASKKELVLAARANPGLALEYLAVERRVGHTIKADLSMAEICADAQRQGPISVSANC